MLHFYRFFYGIVFSSVIIWTIYILTVDFYSIALLTYMPYSITNGPLPIKWTTPSSLITANLATLFIIGLSVLIKKYRCQNLFG